MTLAFSSAVLARVAEELQVLVGGQIQRISQPDEFQVVLSIYKHGAGEKHLLLDCSARFYRAHLTNARAPKAATLLPFCAALRKYIGDGKILKIAQRDGDRILDISIENHAQKFLLTCELMGKHSNLILVGDDGRILHAAKLINHKQSRVRVVLPNREYSSPPAPEFTERAAPQIIEPQPAVEIQSVSAALDKYFASEAPRTDWGNHKRALIKALEKTLSQKRHALEQLRRGAQESTQAAQYRRWGELILGSAQNVKTQLDQGATSARVLDFYSDDQAEISIPLDANLSASENAERLFSRARHVENSAVVLREREENWARETSELEDFLKRVETLEPPAEKFAAALEALRDLQSQAAARGWLRSAQKEDASTQRQKPKLDFEGHKIKKLISPDGFEVLVGETATANDFLVTRLAHSEDFWLHVRGATSAHAIIKTNKAPQRVPPSTLRFAAQQVAQRSVAKHAGLIEVDYTLKKYVRKPRKAPPGSVVISNQKTLSIENQS